MELKATILVGAQYTAPLRAILYFCVIGVFLAACGSAEPQQGSLSIATQIPTLEGNVRISNPQSGSIIYANALYVDGTSENLPDDKFLLRVLTPNDSVLVETVIQPEEDGTWAVEMIHEHTGDPSEMLLEAVPVNAVAGQYYNSETIVISQFAYRPDGTFGSIFTPMPDTTIGGDSFQVVGAMSGVPNNTLTVSLTERNSDPISSTVVTIPSPHTVDELTWSAELALEGYTGLATVRVTYVDDDGETVTLDSVDVVATSVAG